MFRVGFHVFSSEYVNNSFILCIYFSLFQRRSCPIVCAGWKKNLSTFFTTGFFLLTFFSFFFIIQLCFCWNFFVFLGLPVRTQFICWFFFLSKFVGVQDQGSDAQGRECNDWLSEQKINFVLSTDPSHLTLVGRWPNVVLLHDLIHRSYLFFHFQLPYVLIILLLHLEVVRSGMLHLLSY